MPCPARHVIPVYAASRGSKGGRMGARDTNKQGRRKRWYSLDSETLYHHMYIPTNSRRVTNDPFCEKGVSHKRSFLRGGILLTFVVKKCCGSSGVAGGPKPMHCIRKPCESSPCFSSKTAVSRFDYMAF